MTKTKRIQILCLLGAVTLLLSGCWTEAPVESANGLLGDQEPADQQEEVILPAAFTLPYDPDQTLDPVTCADGMQQVAGSLIYEGLFRLDRQLEPHPSVMEIASYCREEKETLWDETKRLFYPHQVHVDLSHKLYDIKKSLLDRMSITE